MVYKYIVRYTRRESTFVEEFRCEAEDYEGAEAQFETAHPDAILINVEPEEPPNAPAN